MSACKDLRFLLIPKAKKNNICFASFIIKHCHHVRERQRRKKLIQIVQTKYKQYNNCPD